jgi:predicted transcriptional regulator
MKISTAESLVMDALWRRSPLAAEEIVDQVAGPQGWSEPTVKSLINRLLGKKAISAEKQGRRYLYRPVLERSHWVSEESRSLLDRVFDGRLAPLVSHFSKTQQLTAEDVAELKRLVEELGDDR